MNDAPVINSVCTDGTGHQFLKATITITVTAPPPKPPATTHLLASEASTLSATSRTHALTQSSMSSGHLYSTSRQSSPWARSHSRPYEAADSAERQGRERRSRSGSRAQRRDRGRSRSGGGTKRGGRQRQHRRAARSAQHDGGSGSQMNTTRHGSVTITESLPLLLPTLALVVQTFQLQGRKRDQCF